MDLRCSRGECDIVAKVTGSRVQTPRHYCKTCMREVNLEEVIKESNELARAARKKQKVEEAKQEEADPDRLFAEG